jgi:hypothetical protein
MRSSPTPRDPHPIQQITALLIIAGMFTSTPDLAQTAPAPPTTIETMRGYVTARIVEAMIAYQPEDGWNELPADGIDESTVD